MAEIGNGPWFSKENNLARADLPLALGEIKRLEKENAELRARLEAYG
jgi:hypothetical protein